MSAIRAYICTGVFTLSLFQPVIARGCLAADVAQAHVALHALAIAPACIAPTASAGGHLHDDVIGAQRPPRGLAAKARGGVDRLAALAQDAVLRRGALAAAIQPPRRHHHAVAHDRHLRHVVEDAVVAADAQPAPVLARAAAVL